MDTQPLKSGNEKLRETLINTALAYLDLNFNKISSTTDDTKYTTCKGKLNRRGSTGRDRALKIIKLAKNDAVKNGYKHAYLLAAAALNLGGHKLVKSIRQAIDQSKVFSETQINKSLGEKANRRISRPEMKAVESGGKKAKIAKKFYEGRMTIFAKAQPRRKKQRAHVYSKTLVEMCMREFNIGRENRTDESTTPLREHLTKILEGKKSMPDDFKTLFEVEISSKAKPKS